MRKSSSLTPAIALLVLTAGVAIADIDVTGQWTIETTDQIVGTQSGSTDLVQTDTVMEWNGGDLRGSIDPVTGAFVVDGDPSGPSGYPPGDHKEGTVTADGNRMEGTGRFYAWFAGFPQAVPYTFRGIRNGVSVCGDDTRDADEPCDFGPFNGLQQCCSATCSIVDPDEDLFCSELDTCPDVANSPDENPCDGKPAFEVRKARRFYSDTVPEDNRLRFTARLRGAAVAMIDTIPDLRLRDRRQPGTYDVVVNDLVCTRTSDSRVDCATPDGMRVVRLRSTSRGGVLKGDLRLIGNIASDSSFFLNQIVFTDNLGLVRQGPF